MSRENRKVSGQLSKMRVNQPIPIHTIDMLCEIIDCRGYSL